MESRISVVIYVLNYMKVVNVDMAKNCLREDLELTLENLFLVIACWQRKLAVCMMYNLKND